eukprot:2427235-Pyramimonas_sp.AAC.1
MDSGRGLEHGQGHIVPIELGQCRQRRDVRTQRHYVPTGPPWHLYRLLCRQRVALPVPSQGGRFGRDCDDISTSSCTPAFLGQASRDVGEGAV